MKQLLGAMMVLFMGVPVWGQNFTDETSALGINVVSASGNQGSGVSFYDIDKDGWDDITFCPNNAPIVIYHNLGGTGFEALSPIPNTFESKAPCWIDYDNDGDADLCFTRGQGRTRLFRNDGNWVFTEQATTVLGMSTNLGLRTYGQSWADYDKDGDLDVYICNKTAFNYLGRNNGNGTFTNVTTAAGVGGHDMGPAFQSVWMDYNRDTWPDLFVIYENLPFQAIYPNQLFKNNGDGTFTNVAVEAGLNDLTQTMCISPSDYDRDGDQDLYVTDVEFVGNRLYQNNNDGTYADVATTAGVVVNSFCWGGLWIDQDNDGFEDLHVATAYTINNNDYFFRNNGDGTFTNTNDPTFENTENGYATAKGDYNNDGYQDFALTKMASTSYQVFSSVPGTHHFVKVALEGTYSNRDAIGTWIDVYANGLHQEVYTMAGENYLAQDSQYEVFGLGTATVVDSLVITWPRGLVEKFYGLTTDTLYRFLEGEATQTNYAIQGDTLLCEGPNILDAGNWSSYAWSTGESDRSIAITAAGIYSVQVTDANGYSFIAELEVVQGEAVVPQVTVNNIPCSGLNNGSILLTLNNDQQTAVWSDGEVTTERTELSAGEYSVNVIELNGCSTALNITITEPAPIIATATTTHETCPDLNNGTVQWLISGGVPEYSINSFGTFPQALAPGEYLFEITDANGCTIGAPFMIEEAIALQLEIQSDDVSCFGSTDGAALLLGNVPFEAVWPDGANTVSRDDLTPGEYTLQLTYGDNCTTTSTVEIGTPDPVTVQMEWLDEFVPDLGWASATATGGTAPYTYIWNTGSNDTLITNLTGGVYTCTVFDANGCIGEGSVTLLTIGVNESTGSILRMVPLSQDTWMLSAPVALAEVRVYDAQGRRCTADVKYLGMQCIVHMPAWCNGVYFVHALLTDGRTATLKKALTTP